jgi:hypothetical protein
LIDAHFWLHGEDYRVYPGDGPPFRAKRRAVPDERRVIWVLAVPSSGTSCIAGVLHHLGVDMGVSPGVNERRGYQMFEDIEAGFYAFAPTSPLDKLLNQRLNIREYLSYRFYKNPRGRIGMKALPTSFLYDSMKDPASLQVEILDVRRPLEDSIIADQNRMAQRPMRSTEEMPATVFQHCNRAGGLAAMWTARDFLLKLHPAKLTVQFYEFLEQPRLWMDRIIEIFDLEPTDEQMAEAMHFVKPKMRTV